MQTPATPEAPERAQHGGVSGIRRIGQIGRIGLIVAVSLPLLLLGHWISRLKPPAPRTARPALESGPGSGAPALDIPAPPSSERLFRQAGVGAVANLGGAPGEMLRYRSSAGIPALVSYYGAEMARRGWAALERESAEYSRQYPGQILAFRKGRATCLIAISESETEGATMVTVLWREAPPTK